MDTLLEILSAKPRGVIATSTTATVRQATRLMNDHGIGSLLVTGGNRLVGIFTERDVLRRVVAEGRSPDSTTLRRGLLPSGGGRRRRGRHHASPPGAARAGRRSQRRRRGPGLDRRHQRPSVRGLRDGTRAGSRLHHGPGVRSKAESEKQSRGWLRRSLGNSARATGKRRTGLSGISPATEAFTPGGPC